MVTARLLMVRIAMGDLSATPLHHLEHRRRRPSSRASDHVSSKAWSCNRSRLYRHHESSRVKPAVHSLTNMSETLAEHLKKRPEYREPSRRARLSYLYSDLSQARTNNPTSFQSSVAWWSNLIEEIVSKGLQDGGGDSTTSSDKLVWHLDQDFLDRLRWEGAGRPTGLGTVAVRLEQIACSFRNLC